MLDIKFLRENPDAVKENIKKKFQDDKLPLVDEVIALDAQLRAAIKEAEKRGSGVIAVNGKMVDRPVVIRAQRTIDLAIASGILTKEEVYE